MRSDEELMVALQTGDEGALGALMDRWKGPLYAFLQRRAGASVAEDLFQEAWLRVVRARGRFDPRRRFSTWLFQIANNLCRDRARRRAADARRHDAARAAAPAAGGRAGDPDADLAARLAARLDAERELARLPDRLREVLVLRYYHDLGEREMAELLEIPRGTVKSRLHAALAALRERASAAARAEASGPAARRDAAPGALGRGKAGAPSEEPG